MLEPSRASRDCLALIHARVPDVGPVDWMVVCGSGMGKDLVGDGDGSLGIEIETKIALRDLGLPAPSVEGHGQSLVFGRMGERRVCLQTGRVHPYEGHDLRVGTAALSAMLELGAGALVLTCAVGALNPDLEAGQLVNLKDQMNLFGPTPLVGAKFIDCSELYAASLRARIDEVAAAEKVKISDAVYAHARGPQYETPTECAALRMLGGDVVGMSTTYEAILGAAHETATCGVGVVTNAAGSEGLSHLEVQEVAKQARGRLGAVLRQVLTGAPPA